MEHKPRTQDEWRALSEAIRAHQFRGRATGQGLVVDYYFDPKTSGACLFVWQIVWDRTYTPTIVVARDGTEIRRETGMFNGEFGSQILKRGQRHIFKFRLIDGSQELPNPLLIELTLPGIDRNTIVPQDLTNIELLTKLFEIDPRHERPPAHRAVEV